MPIEREHCVKGGKNVPAEKRSFSQKPHLASEAGRRGGKNAQKKLAEQCRNCGCTHRKCAATRAKRGPSDGWDFKGPIQCCPECTHTFKVKNNE